MYRNAGLNMLPFHATFENGGFGLEPSIQSLFDRMRTDRLKVFPHLNEWFEEFRIYHRKDGKVVTKRDDLLSATRYLEMMLRFSEVFSRNQEEDEVEDYWGEGRSAIGGY
jgi:hypothetical protein